MNIQKKKKLGKKTIRFSACRNLKNLNSKIPMQHRVHVIVVAATDFQFLTTYVCMFSSNIGWIV